MQLYGIRETNNKLNSVNYANRSEWVSDLSLMVYFRRADSEIHVIHKKHVIMTYTLELSSLA